MVTPVARAMEPMARSPWHWSPAARCVQRRQLEEAAAAQRASASAAAQASAQQQAYAPMEARLGMPLLARLGMAGGVRAGCTTARARGARAPRTGACRPCYGACARVCGETGAGPCEALRPVRAGRLPGLPSLACARWVPPAPRARCP